MLTNLNINVLDSQPLSNTVFPKTATSLPKKTNDLDQIFSPFKLPVKQYSNKFLREHKPRQELLYKQGKKKYSFMNKSKVHNKENSIKTSTKTQQDESFSFTQSVYHSGMLEADRSDKTMGDKISTSRALELYSRIHRREGMEPIRVKKQLIHNTTDVHIKQLTLNDKQATSKLKIPEKHKIFRPKRQKPLVLTQKKLKAQTRPTPLIEIDQPFEIVGW